jgi:hypothetical protein
MKVHDLKNRKVIIIKKYINLKQEKNIKKKRNKEFIRF